MSRARAFLRDQRGASAVEFAIVSIPFIFILLFILQMGVYYMTQSSLDAGIVQAADTLVNSYNSGTAPAAVTTTSLRALVVSRSGGLIRNDTTLLVDLRPFSALAAAPLPIANYADAGVARTVLALRAQSSVVTFMPGLSTLAVVRSSAIVRRQGQ